MNLSSIEICFSGIGGRTVAKLRSFDLGRVRAFQPHVVILEIGSNDLCEAGQRSVRPGKFVVVCQILNRATAPSQHPDYNLGVQVLNNYLKVVLEPLSYAEFWNHKGLRRPSIPMLLRDGVHLNDRGNYALYRSYRGAILFALKKLFSLAQRT